MLAHCQVHSPFGSAVECAKDPQPRSRGDGDRDHETSVRTIAARRPTAPLGLRSLQQEHTHPSGGSRRFVGVLGAGHSTAYEGREALDIDVVSLRRGRTSELLAVSVGQAGKRVVEAQIRTTDGGFGPVCEPQEPPTLVDPLSRPPAAAAMRAVGVEPPEPSCFLSAATRQAGARAELTMPVCAGWPR